MGNEAATGVSATLVSASPLFVVTDPVAAFGDIPAGGSVVNTADPFGITVDASVPPETPVLCSVFVTGDDYNDTLRFTVVVGEFRAVDPIPDGPRTPALYWAYDDGDTQYSGHPEFSWVEVAGLGTQLTLGDDETVPVDLPTGFSWQYYGQQFTQVSICGNGWVAPGNTTNSGYTNVALPATGMPGMVCLNWDDLYPPAGNGVWYYHDADNHRFIIEYDSVAYYAQQTLFDKFQVIIYDSTVRTPTGDNEVVVQYLTANGYSSNTAGMQDPSAAVGIQCLFDGAYHRGTAPLAPGRAIKYTTASPTTGIAENPGRAAQSLRLGAWPNPFTSSVRLSAPAGRVRQAAIFDNCGRLVRTLERAGERGDYAWNGASTDGTAMAPGVYFFRVTTDAGEDWTKLVLSR